MEQVATVRELRALVAQLSQRVEQLEADRGGGGPQVRGWNEERTDRRHLLTKAGAAAVGAVVGGTALAVGGASPAAAASGTFDGDPAVSATASPGSGTAITATSVTGTAIEASSTSAVTTMPIKPALKVTGTAVPAIEATSGGGRAVDARATGGGEAVYAFADDGRGVLAVSTEQYGLLAASQVSSQVMLDGFPPPPLTQTDVPHYPGEIRRDAPGFDLWYCVAEGQPGVWRKLSGSGTAGALHALPTPKRVYDSRPGLPPTGIGPKTPLAANTPRTIDLKGNASGVPAGATAALVNLIATGTTSALGGYMTIYRNGIAWPGTSNLNWSGPGETVAVTTITALDADALCNVYAGSVTDVVVDVLGYYQ